MTNIEMLRTQLNVIKEEISKIEKSYGKQYVPESLKTKRDDLRLQINSMEIEEERISKAKAFRDNLAETLKFVRIDKDVYRSGISSVSKNIVIRMTVTTNGKAIRVYVHTDKADNSILEIDPVTLNYTGSDFTKMSLDDFIKIYNDQNIFDVIDIKYMIDSIQSCLNSSRAARESKLHE